MISDVTTAPVSMTTSLFSSVSFLCEGTGDVLIWLIETVSITDSVQQERNITITDNNIGGNLSSVLTIIALPINDGVHIGCILASFNPYLPVLIEVVLTIRGQ